MAATLYLAAGSCSLVAHVALIEGGVATTPVRIDMAAGQQRAPWYLALNPMGRVPALIVEDRVITENIAIVSYAASRSEGAVLPVQALDRAAAYEAMSWFAATAQATIGQLFRPERYTDDEPARATLKEDGKPRLLAHFDRIEAMVAGGHVVGSGFSAADIYPVIFWRWGERAGIDMTAYPGWAQHRDAMLGRASVEQALAGEAQPAAADPAG